MSSRGDQITWSGKVLDSNTVKLSNELQHCSNNPTPTTSMVVVSKRDCIERQKQTSQSRIQDSVPCEKVHERKSLDGRIIEDRLSKLKNPKSNYIQTRISWVIWCGHHEEQINFSHVLKKDKERLSIWELQGSICLKILIVQAFLS